MYIKLFNQQKTNIIKLTETQWKLKSNYIQKGGSKCNYPALI